MYRNGVGADRIMIIPTPRLAKQSDSNRTTPGALIRSRSKNPGKAKLREPDRVLATSQHTSLANRNMQRPPSPNSCDTAIRTDRNLGTKARGSGGEKGGVWGSYYSGFISNRARVANRRPACLLRAFSSCGFDERIGRRCRSRGQAGCDGIGNGEILKATERRVV